MTEPTTATNIKLGIAQMLLESVNFRHRGELLEMPAEKPHPSPAEVRIDVRTDEDEKQAAVRVRVVSDAPEAPYVYDVSYLVILTFQAPVTQELKDQLLVTGGSMVLPFVRELISNLSGRSRYGATWLQPVDFTAMILKRRAAEAASRAEVALTGGAGT